MRLPFVMICVAVAACLVGVDAEAGPPEIKAGLAHLLSDGQSQPSTEKPLRSYEEEKEEERGITDAGTKSVASALYPEFSTEHFEEMLEASKPPDEVFTLLKLDNAADNLLDNPRLKAWIKYKKLFKEKNPSSEITLRKLLLLYYKKEGLAKIIEDVKEAKRLAKQLQWLEEEKDPEDVFKTMHVDKAGNKLFENPKLARWAQYVDAFNEEYPTKATLLRQCLLYEDKDLINMMFASEPSRRSRVGKRVLDEMIQFWIVAGIQPAEIFDRFGLQETGVNPFRSPRFAEWMWYVDEFNLKQDRNAQNIQTALSVLNSKIKRDRLVEMLLDSDANSSTKRIAKQLQEQVQNEKKEWEKKAALKLKAKELLTSLKTFLKSNKARASKKRRRTKKPKRISIL